MLSILNENLLKVDESIISGGEWKQLSGFNKLLSDRDFNAIMKG